MIEASVTAAAYGVEPLSTNEIDAHPDAARIWATIQKLRDTHAAELDGLRDAHSAELDGLRDAHSAELGELRDKILDIRFVVGIEDGSVTMVADDYPNHEFHRAINDALSDVLPRLKVLFSMLKAADR